MKLDQIEQLHTDIEVVSEMEKFRQYTFVGSKKVHPGHSVFALNLSDGSIEKVKYDLKVDFGFSTKTPVKKGRVITKDNSLYTTCLNMDNAEKHFGRMLRDIRSTAKFIRDYPLMNIENWQHWDILKLMGFETFTDETRKSAALVEKTLFTKKESTKDNKGFEQVSVCHFVPMFRHNEVVYEMSLAMNSFEVHPTRCTELDLAELLTLAFYNFADIMKSDKRLSPKYKKGFTDRWGWLIMLEENQRKDFVKLLKENLHVNNTKRSQSESGEADG